MTPEDKAKVILREAFLYKDFYRYPYSRFGLISKKFRYIRPIFENVILLLEDLGQPLSQTKRDGDCWTARWGTTSLVALPLPNEFLCGHRFNTLFVNDLSEFSQQEIQISLLPFLSVNHDPVTRMERDKLENLLIEKRIFKPSDRTRWSDPSLIDLAKEDAI